MAKLCVGPDICWFINRLSVLVIFFGLSFSNEFVIKEVSELVEDVEQNSSENQLHEIPHDIVRRAAAGTNHSTQPSMSALHPFPTTVITPRITSASLQQYTSAKHRASSTSLAMSKTTPAFTAKPPISLPPITSRMPTNRTGESTTKPYSKHTVPPQTETTASDRRPSSTLRIQDENHKYYGSQYRINGRQWWFNLDGYSRKAKFHQKLSKNEIFSDVLRTSFSFPYYGHLINYVTITNKGYVFLGEILHKFNASAQYAAPLMADFGAGLHDKTSIRYIDTGDRLTVEWANMRVNNESPDKQFSFQCSILQNGTLIFAYKNIPIPVNKLKTKGFFVRVGLSDTFRVETLKKGPIKINGRRYSAVRIIKYYLYHKIQLPKKKVVNGAAFVITPFPNCVMFNSCHACLNTKTQFDCRWCPNISRCSDGFDRHRMDWESGGCLDDSLKSCSTKTSSLTGGEIAVIVIVVVLVITVFSWFIYAYYHPQTKSGLFLIKYGNPTKWCRNSSGETPSTSTDGRISFKTMPFESSA